MELPLQIEHLPAARYPLCSRIVHTFPLQTKLTTLHAPSVMRHPEHSNTTTPEGGIRSPRPLCRADFSLYIQSHVPLCLSLQKARGGRISRSLRWLGKETFLYESCSSQLSSSALRRTQMLNNNPWAGDHDIACPASHPSQTFGTTSCCPTGCKP